MSQRKLIHSVLVTCLLVAPIGTSSDLKKLNFLLFSLPMGYGPEDPLRPSERKRSTAERTLGTIVIQGHECTRVERSCRTLFTLDLFESIAPVLWFFSLMCNLFLFGSS